MSLLFSVFLVLQIGVRNDISELRQYLGKSYAAAIQLLNAKNQILLSNTERLAPAQAAQMRAQMQTPDVLPADKPIVSARIQNVGEGLLTFLFEDDFLVEQVNFVFCPAQTSDAAAPEHVMAIQVLFDDRRTLGSTFGVLQGVYQMPPPIVSGPDYKPLLMYPVAANLPATIWDLNTAEAVYQVVPGNRLITGQLWFADKDVVMHCMNIPKLPGISG
jgi:hypothetical protein